MYTEAYPPDPKAGRRTRLRALQLAAIKAIEPLAQSPADPADPIEDWLATAQAQRLRAAGTLTLGQLARVIAERPKAWHKDIRAIGESKAVQIEAFLRSTLPASAWPTPRASDASLPAVTDLVAPTPGDTVLNPVEAWINAKAGSKETARRYRREAERWAMWLRISRRKQLLEASPEDCTAYLAFLQHLPEEWVSTSKDKRLTGEWKPFAGPLSVATRRQIIGILSALSDWLESEKEIDRNPWNRTNRKIGDERESAEQKRHAVSDAVLAELHAHLSSRIDHLSQSKKPDKTRKLKRSSSQLLVAHRTRFCVAFLRHTGLRSDELLTLNFGHIKPGDGGHLFASVLGKGAKARLVPVVGDALDALNAWSEWRSAAAQAALSPDMPIVHNEAGDQLTYSGFYRAFKTALRAAARSPSASAGLREAADRVSPHWLRHTAGTALLEQGLSLDMVGDLLGHADPRTTKKYAKSKPRAIRSAAGDLFDPCPVPKASRRASTHTALHDPSGRRSRCHSARRATSISPRPADLRVGPVCSNAHRSPPEAHPALPERCAHGLASHPLRMCSAST
jgi:site-specific recombinase XerD